MDVAGTIPPDPTTVSTTLDELPVPDLFDLEDNTILDFINAQQFDQHLSGEFGDSRGEIVANDPGGQIYFLGNTDQFLESHNLAVGNLATSSVSSEDDKEFLSRLRTSEPLARQSANLVMEALCAIPQQMLRRATFPPFIHPHWDRPTMPEPLAVCMRIAQLFASRTLDIKPFIWRTMLAEQRRIIEQVRIPFVFPLHFPTNHVPQNSCQTSLNRIFLPLYKLIWYMSLCV